MFKINNKGSTQSYRILYVNTVLLGVRCVRFVDIYFMHAAYYFPYKGQ
jgi:hypothetical protein